MNEFNIQTSTPEEKAVLVRLPFGGQILYSCLHKLQKYNAANRQNAENYRDRIMTIEKDPACESLESIEIPQGITEIYDNTFRCTGLKSMVIPDGVMTIGSDSFAYCESLESVVIPESVLYINSFR